MVVRFAVSMVVSAAVDSMPYNLDPLGSGAVRGTVKREANERNSLYLCASLLQVLLLIDDDPASLSHVRRFRTGTGRRSRCRPGCPGRTLQLFKHTADLTTQRFEGSSGPRLPAPVDGT